MSWPVKYANRIIRRDLRMRNRQDNQPTIASSCGAPAGNVRGCRRLLLRYSPRVQAGAQSRQAENRFH